MSCNTFDPNCRGCRPGIINAQTGQVLPDTDPLMMIVNSVWDASTIEEQEAFWKVTVKNSRDPQDLSLAEALSARVQAKMRN